VGLHQINDITHDRASHIMSWQLNVMRVVLTYVCHTVPCAIAVQKSLTTLKQEPLKTVNARNDVLTCYRCVQLGQSNVCHTAELFFTLQKRLVTSVKPLQQAPSVHPLKHLICCF